MPDPHPIWPRQSTAGFTDYAGLEHLPMQVFQNVTVQSCNGRIELGALWPNFHTQHHARLIRGGHTADTPPIELPGEAEIIDRSTVWIGIFDGHFGHFIAETASRIPQSIIERPDDLLLFSKGRWTPAKTDTPFFWEIIDWFGVPRDQVRIITDKHTVRELRVAPQAETLGGSGTPSAYLDFLDKRAAEMNLSAPDRPFVYVCRSELSPHLGRHAGEKYLVSCLKNLGVPVLIPEKTSVAEQIETYATCKTLIFSEGSALHGRQLLGRIHQNIVVLNRRRNMRMVLPELRGRCDRVAYAETAGHEISFLDKNGKVLRFAAMAIYDVQVLISTFEAIGIPLRSVWDNNAYMAARDQDLSMWFQDIYGPDTESWVKPHNSEAHIEKCLKQAGLEHLVPEMTALASNAAQ